MYNFKDTTDHSTPVKVLPSEAVMINGVYLENVIDGYRTLYVKGRESLSPEIELGEVGVRNGAYLKNKRFPARVLTIGYQIVAHSTGEFNLAFQKLNDYLNVENAQIIFADETDKYLTGTPSGYDEVPEGQLSIKSEFTIVCADPFKYSTTEYEVAPTLDDGTTFLVDYQGTYPAYPVLQTDFYKNSTKGNTDGDCGYVAFSTQNADVLQFGSVAEPEYVNETVTKLMDSVTTTWTEKKCLVNEPFDSLTGWTRNDGYTGSEYYTKNGTASIGKINGGSDNAVYPSDFGTGNQWRGTTVKKAIPSDGGNPAVTGAKDWSFHSIVRFASYGDSQKKRSGILRISLLDSGGRSLAYVTVWKGRYSLKGTIIIAVNGAQIKFFEDIDLSYYNYCFGFKKNNNDKRPCNIDITKVGSKFTFNVGGYTFSYTLASLANSVATHVSIYMGKWDVSPAVFLGVYACQFTSLSVTQTKTTETWEQLTRKIEVENTFTTNDVLVCDCADGSVRLFNAYATDEVNGGLHPELGALGNDWESFMLTKGVNQIGTMYSDWVTDAHKPTFLLRYRERFL